MSGKGPGRRQGANDKAHRENADKTGFPPDSPTIKKLNERDTPNRSEE